MAIDNQLAKLSEDLDEKSTRYDSVGDALTGVATTVGGVVSGAVGATLGLPTDLVGIVSGLKEAATAEDGKRLDAFADGFSEFSKENLGSQYYKDVFDNFVDSLDVDPTLKEDAKSGFSAGELITPPIAGGGAVKAITKIDKIKDEFSRAEAMAVKAKQNATRKVDEIGKEFNDKAPKTYTRSEVMAMTAKREPSPVKQMTEADQMISVFPKPERMFPKGEAPKGGDYLNPKTGDVITGKNVESANIKINPDGRPDFKASNSDVASVGSVGKGNSQVLTNLFKRFSQKPKDGTVRSPDAKGNWQWTKTPDGFDKVQTVISVTHKGKHYYSLETDFTKGVNLKKYPNKKDEPKLRPTVVGQIELGQPIGEISVRGNPHKVYNKIKTFNRGGLMART
jgi:hypothetical protein|tara:strand:+ start:1432 stop:2616 length:1185 start_codon:yes stop_codon:yes gene_type:complete